MRLNEFTHTKPLKTWEKRIQESLNCDCYSLSSSLFSLLCPSSSLSLSLFPQPQISLYFGTSFLHYIHCKLAQPRPKYNHRRDTFDRDGVADKLLNTMLNCLLLLGSGELLFFFLKTPRFKANMINIQSRQTSAPSQSTGVSPDNGRERSGACGDMYLPPYRVWAPRACQRGVSSTQL